MAIVYREITEKVDLFDCLTLQKKVFGLTDLQTVSMLILNALGNNPSRSGMVVGAFDTEKNEVVGFGINICTTTPDTLYNVAIGVLPEYQNSRSGVSLLENMFKIARKVGFNYAEFYFNPLKQNLGRLYINYYQAKGIRFMYDAFPEFENSHRIFGKAQTMPIDEQAPHDDIDINSTPFLAENQTQLDSDAYLLRIPNKGEDTTFFFNMLDRLINSEGYIMENCLTLKQDGKRQNFYLLQKCDVNHLFR